VTDARSKALRVVLGLHAAGCVVAALLHALWTHDRILTLRLGLAGGVVTLPSVGLVAAAVVIAWVLRARARWWGAAAYVAASGLAVAALSCLDWHDLGLAFGYHGRFGCHVIPSPYWLDERSVAWWLGAPPVLLAGLVLAATRPRRS
jgi:hypothetical protein